MKDSIYKQTSVILFLFCAFMVNAQLTYESSLTEKSENLEGRSLNGYSTVFDFSREEVRRGWWEYAKKFSNPVNMKTYYRVNIPSDHTDGNVDLMLYSKTEVSDSGVGFFLGIEENAFNSQIKNLILDFKRAFYIKKILEKIKEKEIEATRMSRDYVSTILSDERVIVLDSLSKVISSIDSLRNEIKGVATK
ncbi:MAG: hypothetical protein GDA37_00195 [Ekhidna sp.]|nr:hypothetical protein [Ekhidna sp.]